MPRGLKRSGRVALSNGDDGRGEHEDERTREVGRQEEADAGERQGAAWEGR